MQKVSVALYCTADKENNANFLENGPKGDNHVMEKYYFFIYMYFYLLLIYQVYCTNK